MSAKQKLCEWDFRRRSGGCYHPAITTVRRVRTRRAVCGIHCNVATRAGWVDETMEALDAEFTIREHQRTAIAARVDDGRCRSCPRCGQYCFSRYPMFDVWVCGFCIGVGPDGRPTGAYGKVEPARLAGSEAPR